MRISQGHLNLLETCPRKFQHTYLEQLGAPSDFEQQERQQAGSQFHMLMQQWEMGLPIESLLQEDDRLRRWFGSFVDAEPKILGSAAPPVERYSEHLRTLEFEGHVLVVVYDLLVTTEQQAQILDWKTYPKPTNGDRLARNWQSRLYPFVMAETSAYAPEQISMTYWFFQSLSEDVQPQSLHLPYDRVQHEQTRQDLTRLLTQLTDWIDRFEQTGESFPQVDDVSGACDYCSYGLRCQRSRDEESVLTDVDAIAEIPL